MLPKTIKENFFLLSFVRKNKKRTFSKLKAEKLKADTKKTNFKKIK